MLLRVLLPRGIVHPDSVSRGVVFVLDGREELVDNVLFRPVAVEPHQETGEQQQENSDTDFDFKAAGGSGIVDRGIHQGHSTLSIYGTRGEEKVPGQVRGYTSNRTGEDARTSIERDRVESNALPIGG